MRGVANADSLSGRIVRACDSRRVVLLLSKQVVAEYHSVLGSPEVADRHPAITPGAVEIILRRLRYVSEWQKSPVRFRFDRDPGDEPLIELAIAGDASHLVTFDNDLLALTSGHDEAAKRFRQRLPAVKVVDVISFMREYGAGI